MNEAAGLRDQQALLLSRSASSADESMDFFDQDARDEDMLHAMPLRTIQQVHRSKSAFISKRFIDTIIVADIFLVAINFNFWVEFSFYPALQA